VGGERRVGARLQEKRRRRRHGCCVVLSLLVLVLVGVEVGGDGGRALVGGVDVGVVVGVVGGGGEAGEVFRFGVAGREGPAEGGEDACVRVCV
jgi:hypothetical protein